MLNGADGLGEIAAGLVSQGLTILEAVRKGVGIENPASGNGTSPRRLSQTPATPASPATPAAPPTGIPADGIPADGHSG